MNNLLFVLDRIDHNKITEEQSLAIVSVIERFKNSKLVIWKNGEWLFVRNGKTWSYEQDPDFLLTIDLSKEDTYLECVE